MTHGHDMNARDVETKLADLRNDLVAHRNDLSQSYAELPPMDPRRVVARHLKAVVSSSYLSWIFLREELADKPWWQHHFGQVDPSFQDEVHDYEVFVAATCVLYPFSLFEAGMRRVVRAIDAGACGGGTADFKSIYEWLLKQLRKSGWTFSEGDAGVFVDLYRTVRNTLHNNSHYYSATGDNITIEWRGVMYDFVHTQPPVFIGWDFNVMLVRDLGQLNREIMESEIVSQLPAIP
jgi:hypothetical protein